MTGRRDKSIPLDPQGLGELAERFGQAAERHRKARAIMGAFVATDAVALAGRMAEFDGFRQLEPSLHPVAPAGNRKARRARSRG